MALILPLLAITLGALSLIHGWDSRETLRSKEHELATSGVRWPEPLNNEQELADELALALQRHHASPRELAADVGSTSQRAA